MYYILNKILLTWNNGPNVVDSTDLSINWYFLESIAPIPLGVGGGFSHSNPVLSFGSTVLSGPHVEPWFSLALNGPLKVFSIVVRLKLQMADPAILFSGVVNTA